ncbi:MAG: glycoside hydrolase family 9 protein [Fibromonadales bacterium]|nr:glycoside hydrolase family 9 protein [Fibromonadales bacterium]
MRKLIIAFVVLLSFAATSWGQGKVHINQIGFGTNAKKQAVYVGTPSGIIAIKSVDGGTVNKTVAPGAEKTWTHSFSGEKSRTLDFTSVTATGYYAIFEGNEKISPVFQIGVSYDELARDALRFYYYHRADLDLEEPYAEGFPRAAGHSGWEAKVYNNAGAITASTILSTRGWYDAGDYGRYVVNSGITTYTLLALYEKYASKIPDLNIPAEGTLPDLLAEIKWNLDWMISMQADDGGVHHKMTTENFGFMNMAPEDDTPPLMVMGKTTAATLNFAGVMAVASRIYREFDPTYADDMLTKAKSAWAWAKLNPNHYYYRSEVTSNFPANAVKVTDPTGTGPYEDNNVAGEFFFAAAALATVTSSTEQTEFIDYVDANKTSSYRVSSGGGAVWQDVGSLGALEIARHLSAFPTLQNGAKTALTNASNAMVNTGNGNGYNLPFGNLFYWGSNAAIGNIGIQLLAAYEVTDNIAFKNAAQSILDYMLGRNPIAQSYVTGYGVKPPVNPHDRHTMGAYGGRVFPGQVVGGAANSCTGPTIYSTELATRYEDKEECYANNEIAINWNAPLTYLATALSEEGESIKSNGTITRIDDLTDGWYAFPMGSATYNEDADLINPEGYVELVNINAYMEFEDWDNFSAVAIGLNAENNGTEYDLSECTDGFSYDYKGVSHRFTFEMLNGVDGEGEATFATFYGVSGLTDGQLTDSPTAWRTVKFTSFERDEYNNNDYDGAFDLSGPGHFRWAARPFDGAIEIEDGSLQIRDFQCLKGFSLDLALSDVPADKTPAATVAAPELNSKTHYSITVKAVVADNGQTVEYAISTSNTVPATGWQTALTFTELAAETPYYIFARGKGDDYFLEGIPSAALEATTNEASAIVAAPELNSKTHNSITIKAVIANNGQTVEYAISTSNTAPATGWQTALTFTGLAAETPYYIFARGKGDDLFIEGVPSAALEATTNEDVSITLPQLAAANIRAYVTGKTITLQNLPANAKVQIYNLKGEQIYFARAEKFQPQLKIGVQTKGIYLAKVNNQTLRIAVK